MTVYWFPDRSKAAYTAYEVTGPVTHLDVFCRPCGAGPRQPRLQRFVRPAGSAQIGVKPFVAEGKTQAAAYSDRNGVIRWTLLCPHGHPQVHVDENQVRAALDLIEKGAAPPGVSL